MTREEGLEFIAKSVKDDVDLAMVADAIEAVSAEPQKIGHWVNGEYCSECGCDVPAYIIDWKWQKDMNAKYCPNCGAKMSENPTGSEYESDRKGTE